MDSQKVSSAYDLDYDSEDDELFEDENFVRNVMTVVKAPDVTRCEAYGCYKTCLFVAVVGTN